MTKNNLEEIEKRLEVIEAILGINPDHAQLIGDSKDAPKEKEKS